MLHLSIMELVFRAIPDSITLILGTHIFSGTKVNKTKITQSICFISLIIFFIRRLPITFGIHTLLGVLGIVITSITFHKIEVIKAVKAVFFTMFIQYISEIINLIWIQVCLGMDIETIFSNPTTKILYGIPSLLISFLILFLFSLKAKSREDLLQ